MASYPTVAATFPTRTDGSNIFADHVNGLQDEVAAIEAALLGTLAHPLTLGQALRLAGLLSPAQITADQNDYNPTGLSTASQLRLSTDAARAITGLTAQSVGQIVSVCNIGSFNLTLSHDNAGSAAANRILCPNNTDLVLQPNAAAVLTYDNVTNRWRVIAAPPQAVSTASTPRAFAYHNTTQALNDATWTTLNLNSEDLDVGNCHDNAVNNPRLTVPAGGDGLYLIGAAVTFAASTAGARAVRILKNAGATLIGTNAFSQGASGAGAGSGIHAVAIAALVAGDYVYMDALQTSGGVMNSGSAGARQFQNSLFFVKLL